MRTKTLLDFFEIQKQEITLPLSDSSGTHVKLQNQLCHLLFEDRESKEELFKSIKEPNAIAIFDCGRNGFQYLPENFEVLDNFSSLDELLSSLEDILDIKACHPLYHKSLNTIIIDNLSVYYWDLKLLNSNTIPAGCTYKHKCHGADYYLKLLTVLKKIKQKTQCNIITTSWSNTFEKGYNYSNAESKTIEGSPNDTEVDKFTFLPKQYLASFDFVIHSQFIASKSYVSIYDGRWIKTC
ncbi:Piso0_005040 [Millerozyma farinosa CBS 7064]|uniref:Piso0_005040 protein n=1 Tax=Pichia sorbitophila (strain ATCC MYA-4447 / BCRC 22081 / CBS 7064 / NBRC 10061 / NRRL Y-12695) TaxID=559304 RepID=G8Y426_PICSO|nr:Piso0_005040 [Millerozyma farinosa CBS 7064]